MPDPPHRKFSTHPWRASAATRSTSSKAPEEASRSRSQASYAELQTTSNFTFLTGASQPEELVRRAAELGYRAIAITDRNSLAGIVRAHVAAKEVGLSLVVGCRIVFVDSPYSLLVYPKDRDGYGRLCRLLTLGKRRAPKGECHLEPEDLGPSRGWLAVVPPPVSLACGDPVVLDEGFERFLFFVRELFDDGASDREDRLSLAAPLVFGPDDAGVLARLSALSKRARVPLVATNDVHYHDPERRPLQDVLTCIREGCTVDEAGLRLFANGERYLKPLAELERLYSDYPEALARSVEIAERARGFQLDELCYRYPNEVSEPGRSAMEELVELTWSGARERYPGGISERVRSQIEHEFRLIDELDYASYFLTVYDLVRFARSREILCQGRGAAANSAVCYCLGVTAVDPERINLLFERFVSKERGEPPDIDIDFEHERREEVLQYIYAKYGRERAALTAEVITYRGRSAIRDIGKALGFSLDCIDRLAKDVDWWHEAVEPKHLEGFGLDPDDPLVARFIRLLKEILGFPRHLSQHVGGFVITEDPLCELVPIENAAMADRTVIEWDKDDIEAMGMLKVDCLGLGMLTCVRKCFDLVREHTGQAFEFHTVPAEDPAVYDMICEADTVGVFQIESRAQMSMLPRLRPREFYDLVIEVAIVRPGPIQGDMVHPYLRRRNGEEPVIFPSEDVRGVLGKTLGVPLFQEQVMALAVVAGGFTAGEADELRRAMAAWKRKSGRLEVLCRELWSGLLRNGYGEDFATRLIDQIHGFGEYGFPESHAASFALIVYVSAWLKRHHPAAFAAGLLNSQPMGFYAPAQIVSDARKHGVEVRPVDVNHSTWDASLEGEEGVLALRLGMRQVKGLQQVDAERVVETIASQGPFGDVQALQSASGVRVAALRKLAYADAFGSMGLDRQKALWQVRALPKDGPDPLWATSAPVGEADTGAMQVAEPKLPFVEPADQVIHDYASLSLSLKAHPMSFAREALESSGVSKAAWLSDEARLPNGASVRVAGLVLVRQRPGTAKGVIFMTIEDETGVANLIVRPKIFERDRRAARHARGILVHGRIERASGVVHVMAARIESLEQAISKLESKSRDFH